MSEVRIGHRGRIPRPPLSDASRQDAVGRAQDNGAQADQATRDTTPGAARAGLCGLCRGQYDNIRAGSGRCYSVTNYTSTRSGR